MFQDINGNQFESYEQAVRHYGGDWCDGGQYDDELNEPLEPSVPDTWEAYQARLASY